MYKAVLYYLLNINKAFYKTFIRWDSSKKFYQFILNDQKHGYGPGQYLYEFQLWVAQKSDITM